MAEIDSKKLGIVRILQILQKYTIMKVKVLMQDMFCIEYIA